MFCTQLVQTSSQNIKRILTNLKTILTNLILCHNITKDLVKSGWIIIYVIVIRDLQNSSILFWNGEVDSEIFKALITKEKIKKDATQIPTCIKFPK
jgi:hypothetical protein